MKLPPRADRTGAGPAPPDDARPSIFCFVGPDKHLRDPNLDVSGVDPATTA